MSNLFFERKATLLFDRFVRRRFADHDVEIAGLNEPFMIGAHRFQVAFWIKRRTLPFSFRPQESQLAQTLAASF